MEINILIAEVLPRQELKISFFSKFLLTKMRSDDEIF